MDKDLLIQALEKYVAALEDMIDAFEDLTDQMPSCVDELIDNYRELDGRVQTAHEEVEKYR